MTVTARLPRCFVGKIARTFGHGMGMIHMERVKAGGMAGQTGSASDEVFTSRIAGQNAIYIMTITAGTVILSIAELNQRWWIEVTGGTAGAGRTGASNCDQRSVVRGVCSGMGCHPRTGMTGGTIAADVKILADCIAEQSTGSGTMTAGAIRMRIHTNQGVVMTVCCPASGPDDGH